MASKIYLGPPMALAAVRSKAVSLLLLFHCLMLLPFVVKVFCFGFLCVCVCLCVCVRASVCARASERACASVRARACARVYGCAFVRACARVCLLSSLITILLRKRKLAAFI